MLNGFGNAQFGTFTTTGRGPSTFADVLFRLAVHQTSPTPGSNFVNANVFGTVSAIQGGLTWGPVSATTFSIGAVNYTISVDALTSGDQHCSCQVDAGLTIPPHVIRGHLS